MTVAIGARSNDNINGRDSGQCRVFKYDDSRWVQLGQTLIGERAGDNFGYSVALSANGLMVIIGAIYNGVSPFRAGDARIFVYGGMEWIQIGGDVGGHAGGDLFGFSVAISSDGLTVAIGGTQVGTQDGTQDSGIARVYQLS
uniref:Uncharacterized protein n=1 Tax=Cyclophora tenuis TaxID=216820 RepID=A0A7S1GQ17_CYCTE